MKRKFFLIGVFAALMMSCENETQSSHDMEHTKDVEHTDEKETNHSEEESVSISLNDGEKWKVNEEMLPHIKKSEAVFNSFEGDDYQKLSKDMMMHTNNLIQSCTMDGKSHDELHKWLHPHLELIKALGNKGEGAEKYAELKHSFEVFHKYFK
jgi:hypothetical protein